MKFIKLLSLPAVSILSLSIQGDKITHDAKFNFNDVFYDLADIGILNFSIRDVASTDPYLITLKGYLATNNQLLFEQNQRITEKRRAAAFSIDMANYLTSYGLKVEFSFITPNKGEEKKDITLYPDYESQIIHSNLYKNEIVKIDNVCFGMIGNKLFNSESYDFTNLNEYFTKNNGGQIDLSEVHFEYSVSNFFRYSEAYLEITDYQNLFPLIGASLLKKVPVFISQSSKSISFSTNSGMYVNNVTHEMSDTPIENFVETNNFYIPINKEKEFMKNEFKLVIKDAGFSHSEIFIPLIFYSDSNSIGFCYDSDICVSGGVRQ